MSKIHQLKTWPDYFEAVFLEKKPFEVRLDDRNFQVGDVLILREYDPATGEYSGRQLARNVTYKLPGGGFGVEAGYCVLGIK
jgi:hypothetical protein